MEWESDDHRERYQILTMEIQSFEFLAGLNSEFQAIRGQILSRDALPSLQQIYYIVQSEDSRQKAMNNLLNNLDFYSIKKS